MSTFESSQEKIPLLDNILTTYGPPIRSQSMKAKAPAKLNLTQLVTHYYATVFRYLRVLGCNESLAEDISQETFLAVLEKPFFELNDRATSAYLRLVARNLFIDEMRRQRKSVPYDLDQIDLAWEEFERDDAGETWLDALRTCLKSLRGRSRRSVNLQYRDQLSIANIAVALGMKASGVKTLLGRTKQQLRDCVERRVAQND